MLRKIRQISQDRKQRIIMIPIYKSFSDPIILQWIQYLFDMEIGFTVGNFEDSPKIKIIDSMLTKMGILLMKRKDQHNMATNYVNYSLLQDIIENNPITTIFQNDQRSRSGKLNISNFSESVIKMIIKASH